MSNLSTCCIDKCEQPTKAKGYCNKHYQRFRKNGDPTKTASGRMARSSDSCSMDECEYPVNSRGWCSTHYGRWMRTGSPDQVCDTCGAVFILKSKVKYCSEECYPRCAVEGCENPKRGEWCAAHFSQYERFGEVKPFTYKWAALGSPCAVCGGHVVPGSRRRKHCSSACQAAGSWHKGERPESFNCALCKKDISLLGRKPGERLRRTDSIWCRDCGARSPDAQRFKHYGLLPEEYAAMCESGCQICGATDRTFHVDHDHACCNGRKKTCGKCVRGVLCGQCNQGIGMLGDSADNIRAAAKYLDRWSRKKLTA